jgi:uncharacterized membrane protein YjfL (UPF0719 family)
MDVQTALAGHPFFACAALAGAIALVGIVRDYRHSRRANLDKVSLVSWGVVSSIALIVAIVCFAMGLRTGG